MAKTKFRSTNYSFGSQGESELDETARLPVLLRESDVSNEAANDNDFSLSDKIVKRIEELYALAESIQRRLDRISEVVDSTPSRTRQAQKKKTGVRTKNKAVARKKKTATRKKKTVARKKKTTVSRKKKTSSTK